MHLPTSEANGMQIQVQHLFNKRRKNMVKKLKSAKLLKFVDIENLVEGNILASTRGL